MTHIRNTLAIALLIGACNPQTVQNGPKEEPPPLSLGSKEDFPGHLVTKGTIAFGGNVTDTLLVGDGHGYTFDGAQGSSVTITLTAQHPQCAASGATSLDTFVYLFGPPDAQGNRGTELTRNDDDSTLGTCQSAIRSFALPRAGNYMIVASSWLQRSGGQYTLNLTCASGGNTCVPPAPGPQTYADTRIAQADIDAGRFTAAQLFAIGDFLFEHHFTVDEGWGNALTSAPGGHKPRPNARRIHNGAFGGPDGNMCAECHSVAHVGDHLNGHDGGGELSNNLLQAGDGETLSSTVERQPPALIGDGYLQQLGIEMTADLQKQLNDAKTASAGDHTVRTVQLTSKGIAFGSLVVQADGTTVDFSGVQGVDQDLVVKPFGWKGRTASLRRFVEGGFQVHFGMASQALIAKNCGPTPIPNTVGNGPDCHDPDMDGVVDEILEGQLTAMALYPALLQAPTRNNPSDPNAFMRAQAGETLFTSTGCASCHTPTLVLNSTVHLEAPDLSGGAPFAVDLVLDGRQPQLSKASNGTVTVPLFSDLKRHDMGASNADSKATFGVAPSVFITRPIWGVAASPPYMHDGRAPTLRDAILAHDGEGGQARSNFSALAADDQAKLIEFLQTLSRDPNHLED
jgi:hypothetical protein